MAHCAPRSPAVCFTFFCLFTLAGCGSKGSSVCNLADGCGCYPASPQASSDACIARQYVYATGIDGQVSVFPVDPGAGELQSPVSISGPTASLGMTVLDNQFLYVSDFGLGGPASVDGWSIDLGTGALTPGSPFSLGTLSVAGGLAGNPYAQVVYVADAGKIDALKADPSGTLSVLSGSPFPAGSNLYLAVDSGARYLFASEDDPPGGVDAFSIDASSGALTPVSGSPFPAIPNSAAQTQPGEIVVDPSGKYVYLTLTATSQVAGFSIATDGSLSVVLGSPFSAGMTPLALATANEFLYVSNVGDGTVSGYKIDPATGTLSAISGSPFQIRAGALVSNFSGNVLYAAAAGGMMTFGVDSSTGALTQVGSTILYGGASVLAFVQ